MRTLFYVFVGLVAVACANNCTFKAKDRDCSWNVEIIDRSADSKSYVKTKYYVNGLFWAEIKKDYGGEVFSRTVNRPDIVWVSSGGNYSMSLFTATGGKCEQSLGLEFNKYHHDITELLEEMTFDDCEEDVKFDGKECTQYIKYLNSGGKKYYYATSKEIIGVNYSYNDHHIFYDWGTYAPMSKFSFDEDDVYKCPDSEVYKSGDDDYAYCAAGAVKAVFALVLAAVATALLSLN